MTSSGFGERTPIFIIDTSRPFQMLTQDPNQPTVVRTVFGSQDLRWAFSVAKNLPRGDVKIQLLYNYLPGCILAACVQETLLCRACGYDVEVVFVGDEAEPPTDADGLFLLVKHPHVFSAQGVLPAHIKDQTPTVPS